MSTSDNLIKVFEYALNQEKTGMSFFQGSIERMGLGAAVSAFKKLIQEEEKHIVYINNILNNLKTGGDLNTQSVQSVIIEPTNYFDERSRSEFLEQCVDGSMVPDVTVFNVAWLIEKDLAEFYGNAAAQTEGQVSDALGRLAKWEKGHENFFKIYRDKLNEIYSKMPWGG